jgi:hypothetical protein
MLLNKNRNHNLINQSKNLNNKKANQLNQLKQVKILIRLKTNKLPKNN